MDARALRTFVILYTLGILLSLDECIDLGDAGTLSQAIALQKQVASFKFMLQLVIWQKVLMQCKQASDYLQKKNLDLLVASDMLEATETAISALRDHFEEFYEEASNWAEEFDIEPEFPDTRKRKKACLFIYTLLDF